MTAPGEFELIRTYFQRPLADAGVRLGIGDDAALLALPPGEELVVTTDTLVAGRHFPDTAAPFDIGWKALAVNLSDLAAMGAVPAGQALRRAGARAGDEIHVSGTVGDAGLGLRLELGQWPEALDAAAQAFARARLHRPEPRLALGLALRGLATAGLDVSDGLAQDLGHLLAASGVGAELELSALPRSPALAGIDTAFADILALTSGDDYELLFTAPAAARAAIAALPLPCSRIGVITAAAGLRFRRDGAAIDMPVAGFTHF